MLRFVLAVIVVSGFLPAAAAGQVVRTPPDSTRADSVAAASEEDEAEGVMADEPLDVDEYPELLNRAETVRRVYRSYPVPLGEAHVSGRVIFRLRVKEDGHVDRDSIVVAAASHQGFVNAARNVAGSMLFRPARRDGRPVTVWITIPVFFQSEAWWRFRLSGGRVL